MSQHTINITGVKTDVNPQSTPPNRLAIFDVVNDIKSFSLLVQALSAYYFVPTSFVNTSLN